MLEFAGVSIIDISLKMTNLRLQPHLQGANQLSISIMFGILFVSTHIPGASYSNNTVYPIKYIHHFIEICFVYGHIGSYFIYLSYEFADGLRDGLSGTGTIVWFIFSNPERYGIE